MQGASLRLFDAVLQFQCCSRCGGQRYTLPQMVPLNKDRSGTITLFSKYKLVVKHKIVPFDYHCRSRDPARKLQNWTTYRSSSAGSDAL